MQPEFYTPQLQFELKDRFLKLKKKWLERTWDIKQYVSKNSYPKGKEVTMTAKEMLKKTTIPEQIALNEDDLYLYINQE